MATAFALPQTADSTSTSTALPVDFRNVSRTFTTKNEQRTVLADVNLHIDAGQVVAILGASGCGKSTLLRSVSGLDHPSSGAVFTGVREVNDINELCAVAFQEPRLLPWRSVRENISLGLAPGTSRLEGNELIDQLLELTGLSHAAELRPREISGGMAQRVSLARALARRPGVLLLDEPFGALDALTRLKMQDLLLSIHASFPTTVLMVTHDVDEALTLADRVVVLGRRNGQQSATVIEDLRLEAPHPRSHSNEQFVANRARLLGLLGVDATNH
ncbi:ABC transporter ATP-binding protein [Glutamicibacter protophormiae]|uniref:ABC transporter ATP-binding protein n=1 Tax=Glutamicibacter protophormiae TaxID=37930 RepID=UPI002A820187|nr:ABC transporter ATP-binding protein [Glutamicibacter protophormiae]WPR65019.1 ABC transporter ATP-binding protein [Glutamicibacter protophormiae]WPR68516.1 ABC transporter ATP-binding protein [Glutamicibacter protophormiae]